MINYPSEMLSISHIPNVLKASTTEELRRLMLQTNTKHKAYLRYFDIQFAQGKWHAWYISEVQVMPGVKRGDQ